MDGDAELLTFIFDLNSAIFEIERRTTISI